MTGREWDLWCRIILCAVVLWVCGETFYGLLMAGGLVGVAVGAGVIFALVWSVK